MKNPVYFIPCIAVLALAACDRANTSVSSDRGGGPTTLPDANADAAAASGGTGGMVGGTTGGAPVRETPGTGSPENRSAAPGGGTGTGIGTDPASGTNAPGSTGSGPGSR